MKSTKADKLPVLVEFLRQYEKEGDDFLDQIITEDMAVVLLAREQAALLRLENAQHPTP